MSVIRVACHPAARSTPSTTLVIYLRRFTLTNAQDFDRDQISARLVNGVLEVTLPKGERSKPRRFPVSA